MRACPIGLFPDIEEVKAKSTLQCQITHNTKDGIAAAVAASLMTHYFLYDLGDVRGLGEFLDKEAPTCPNSAEMTPQDDTGGFRTPVGISGTWNTPWEGKVGSPGWHSVRAACTAVMQNTKLSSLLKDCINFSGDVDTVATIALAAASCSREYEKDIPSHLIYTLENGRYGRQYLLQLEGTLFSLFADSLPAFNKYPVGRSLSEWCPELESVSSA